MYNVRVNFYNDELQVTHYGYRIMGNFGKEKIEEDEKVYQETLLDGNKRLASDKADTEVVAELNKARSLRRTVQSIYDMARANKWDYFATFTFAEDRYNYDLLSARLRTWLNNFKKRKCEDLEYVVVPEMHKDGAYHFHGLLKSSMLSDYLVSTWHKDRYAIKDFYFGINELERVRDSNKSASYITKYITKELVSLTANKRRYFNSKGVKKSDKMDFDLKDVSIMDFLLANFPEYYMSYNNVVEFNGKPINYIQLKKGADL